MNVLTDVRSDIRTGILKDVFLELSINVFTDVRSDVRTEVCADVLMDFPTNVLTDSIQTFVRRSSLTSSWKSS